MAILGKTYLKRFVIGLLTLVTAVMGMAAKPLPDSLSSIERTYAYNLTDFPLSLSIIHTLQQRKMAPAWKLKMVEGDLYSNTRQLHHAIKAYQQALSSPEIEDSAQVQLQLVRNLLFCYDIVGNEKEVLRMNYRLFELAQKHRCVSYTAIARFMWGKRTFYNEFHDNADSYKDCLEAIQMMKQSDYRYKNQELQIFYGHLVEMYTHDGRYDEAMRISQEQERIVRKGSLTDVPHKDSLLLHRAMAIRCHLLAEMGRMAEADSVYAVCQRMGFHDALANRLIVSYLLERQRYADMLQVVRHVKEVVRQDGDTVGRVMARLLREEATALDGLGAYQESVECYQQMAQVYDSVQRRSASLMTSSVREAIENEQAISHRNILLMFGAFVLVLLVALVVALAIYNRLVQRRNKLMTSTMRRLSLYRDQVLERKKENTDEMEENVEAPIEEDALQRRFLEVDYEITKNLLFTRSDFGRDDLTRMMGVDKNTLPGLFARFTGTNIVWYINSKRMDYAASLMKEHPEYTLTAIAEACGIKSPATFISNFKTTFGMTPSDYRKALETTPPKKTNNGQI